MAAPNYRNYGDYGAYSGGGARYGAAAPRVPEIGRDSDGGEQRRRLERERRRRAGLERRQAARRRGSFVFLVLVPLALLLGSVYLHNVAADTTERITVLQERIDEADSRYEQLEVREAELSNPERIRTLAAEDYGMEGVSALQVQQLEAADGATGAGSD